jgi:2-methylcitrate dehydratase
MCFAGTQGGEFMSTIASQLATYATNLRYRDIPPETAHLAKRMIIDTVACGLGGYHSTPSQIARDMAATVTSTQPCTVMGSGQRTSPDLATFANGVMIRYLDFNDGYTSKESGHPSDSIAAVLTASELVRASGKRAIAATVLAYEAFCRICDAGDIKPYFDHVTVGCIASILGAARSLNLSEAQMLQALNLGIAPNLALYQTRIGDVSMWKGCAYANASRNAVFATLLAQRGLTGPAPIFEGHGGYINTVHRGPFELAPFGGLGQPFKIAECSIKRFPLGQYSQTVVQAALEVRAQLPNVQDIAAVNIETLQTAINIMAGDAEKWHPTNRETADHSMPYTAAVALLYGTINPGHFDDVYLQNQELLNLTSKVNVQVSEEANRRVPEAMLCKMEVVTNSGQRYVAEVAYHKGHYKNPLSDAELEEKYRALVGDVLATTKANALLDRLWHLEEVTDLGEIFKLTII